MCIYNSLEKRIYFIGSVSTLGKKNLFEMLNVENFQHNN